MENISIVHFVAGRKVRRGLIDMIGGYSFALIPDKSKGCVYVAMVGAREDFLQVSAEDWAVGDEPVEAALQRARERIEQSKPESWLENYSARALEEVRAKKRKWHKDYILALLEEHEVYKGKKWQ
jgi:hypothetical protein